MTKTILITGCSSGIGLAAATFLKQRNYRVFATTRTVADVEKLKAMGLESLQLDINDSKSIQTALTAILNQTGGTLDALFNNAGYAQAGAVEDLSRDAMRKQFETNVFGPMELTNAVIPIMRKQGHGRIIQNTSILGLVAMPYRGAYNASKFALEGFTNTLRQELHNTPIFVSAIVPGPIRSDLRKKALNHYQDHLAKKPSEHRAVYDKMEKHFFTVSASERRFTQGPEAVVKELIKALESQKPKAHYYVTYSAHLFAWLRRLLPDAWLDAVMERINRGEM